MVGKIDTFTFADARLWRALSQYVSESEIARACGWKDACNVQIGCIFDRLNRLGDENVCTKLHNAVRWHNMEA
jgi:hypothetical protein